MRVFRYVASTKLMNIQVCGKTSCDNPELQQRLLQWVVHGFLIGCLRGSAADGTGKEHVKKTVNEWLLKRRVVLYLANKFCFKSMDGQTYVEGYKPEVLFRTLFATPLAFHEAFPRGLAVPDYAVSGDGRNVDAWGVLSTVCSLQRKIVDFLRDFLDNRADISSHVQSVLDNTPMISAESFLSSLEFKRLEIFDLEECWREMQDLEAPPAPPAPPPVVADVPLPDAAAIEPEESKSEFDDPVPAGTANDETDVAPPTQTNVEKHFRHLVFCSAVTDQFNSVEPSRFSSMVDANRSRIKTYAEVKVKPASGKDWGDAVASTRAWQTLHNGDRIVYIYDPKNASCTTTRTRMARPFKAPADFNNADFKHILAALFGDPKEDDWSKRKSAALFEAKNTVDVVLVFDGRKPGQSHKNATAMRKAAAGWPTLRAKPVVTFRLMHSNAEFAPGKIFNKKGWKSNTMNAPDPLESVEILFSTAFRLENRPRLYIDLPGNTMARGLAAVPMRPGVGDGRRIEFVGEVSLDTKVRVLEGCLPTVEVEDGFEDLVGAGDDEHDVGEEQPELGEAGSTDEDVGVSGFPLFAWGKSELLVRELRNFFVPGLQVSFNLGNGEEMIAAVRGRAKFLGFALNKLHAEVCEESALAKMLSEQLDAIDDGFLMKRFLSRAESLGGSTVHGEPTRKEGEKEKEKKKKKEKTEKKDNQDNKKKEEKEEEKTEKESLSSSSSLSSDDDSS